MSRADRIAPLIPWYVRGDLDAEERDAVELHLPDCAGCQALLETAREQVFAAGAASAEDLLGHVHPRLLTQYVEAPDRLAAETLQWIEAKLADCETCRQAHHALLAVERHLERAASAFVPAPARHGGWSSLWELLGRTLLRPAPALAYLLALAVLAPLLILDGGRERLTRPAATPRVISIEGDRAARAGDPDAALPPVELAVGADGVLLELVTALDASDLADTGLSYTLSIETTGRVAWSAERRAEDLVLRDGRIVVPLLVEPERLELGAAHEIVLRARKPGDPLHGQALFRRSLRIVAQ